jgi:hypothetical protein
LGREDSNFCISELRRWLIKERKTGQKEWRGVEAWHGREAVYPHEVQHHFRKCACCTVWRARDSIMTAPTFLRCRGPAGCLYSGTPCRRRSLISMARASCSRWQGSRVFSMSQASHNILSGRVAAGSISMNDAESYLSVTLGRSKGSQRFARVIQASRRRMKCSRS